MVMLGRSDVRANVLHGWEPEMRITVTTIQSNTLNPAPLLARGSVGGAPDHRVNMKNDATACLACSAISCWLGGRSPRRVRIWVSRTTKPYNAR